MKTTYSKHFYLFGLKTVFALILFVFMIQTQAKSQKSTVEEIFANANEMYNQGQYDSALRLYETVLEQDRVSAPIYYNAGNTCYKLKNIPKAILYYEKALKLAPNDEDIIKNLEIANARIVDKIEPLPELFINTWWRNFQNLFSPDSWAKVSLAVFGVLLILVFVFLTSRRKVLRKISFFVGILFVLLTICSLTIAAQKYFDGKKSTEAIVFTPTITVKSAPGASSVDLFVLHEGAKVFILDNASGWNKIKIANGSIGWLPEESMVGI